MLLKDLKFKGKKYVMDAWTWSISTKAMDLLREDGIIVSKPSLKRYVEYLIEDTDYNERDNAFYEPISSFKFSVSVFAQITYEYVLEHLDEFKSNM